ncbi:hypothetical protein [Photobacterium halotolerans]|uniref:Glycosyl transferase n=1 Tax=Photobacterium halotolerans TaxID=265726 RepID=A0A0F5VIX6_9GAMM|nr:hypothetical protein [Photobacterium halotolerans]KKD01470.1 hypothetical protein KY46_01175 [Photobacterium halotolerans]
MKTCFTVVLYNTEINESQTLNDIVPLLSESKHKLIIWNNGPNKVHCVDSLLESTIDFDVHETITNISLAKIYNEVIKKHEDYERYVFLDQDSQLPDFFLTNLESTRADIVLPEVIVDNDAVYPVVEVERRLFSQRKIRVNEGYPLSSQCFYLSIGSGIAITKKIIKSLEGKYETVFDERFKIYGVDTTFFLRLNNIKNINGVVSGKIFHSLSRLEEGDKPSKFRLRERVVDNVLTARFYPSLRTLTRLIKFLISNVRYFEIDDFKLLISTLLRGRHPTND